MVNNIDDRPGLAVPVGVGLTGADGLHPRIFSLIAVPAAEVDCG
jgi:hypothetical protein